MDFSLISSVSQQRRIASLFFKSAHTGDRFYIAVCGPTVHLAHMDAPDPVRGFRILRFLTTADAAFVAACVVAVGIGSIGDDRSVEPVEPVDLADERAPTLTAEGWSVCRRLDGALPQTPHSAPAEPLRGEVEAAAISDEALSALRAVVAERVGRGRETLALVDDAIAGDADARAACAALLTEALVEAASLLSHHGF